MDANCPKCGTATTAGEVPLMVVTINPTLPYGGEVKEYACTCGAKWFMGGEE